MCGAGKVQVDEVVVVCVGVGVLAGVEGEGLHNRAASGRDARNWRRAGGQAGERAPHCDPLETQEGSMHRHVHVQPHPCWQQGAAAAGNSGVYHSWQTTPSQFGLPVGT